MKGFYSQDELNTLMALDGGNRDVQSRMPVKITRHYFEQARTSKPLQVLVKASPKETIDLDGAEDPGKQMDYSPVEGLIHKYELGLIYVASTCSAHCRFLLPGRINRQKGSGATRRHRRSERSGAKSGNWSPYIIEHNRLVAENGGRHPETGREKLREILMSGGDPMVFGQQEHCANGWRRSPKQALNQFVSAQRIGLLPGPFRRHIHGYA